MDKLIGEMSSLVEREPDLARHESELDLLESEYLPDTDRFKCECLRELAQKLRAQLRLISSRHGSDSVGGLLDHLVSLRDLATHVSSLDPVGTDTSAIMNARERLLDVKHRLEKLVTSREFVAMLDLSGILGQLAHTESLVAQLIERRTHIDSLVANYRLQSERFDEACAEIEALLARYQDEETLDNEDGSVELELHVSRLKSARNNLTNGQLKHDFDRLHECAKRLESARVDTSTLAYERHRIRFYDLVVRLDKQLKGAESGLGDLRRITEKSQLLLEMIKSAHSVLASVRLRRAHGSVSADKCEFLNFSTNMPTAGDTEKAAVCHGDLVNDSRTINEWIELLRVKVMNRLSQYEPVKAEILRLYARFLKASSRNKRKLKKNSVIFNKFNLNF